jgi:hypothetical protein
LKAEQKLLRKYFVDTDYIHNVSNKLGLVVMVELGYAGYRVIGVVDEHNPRIVKSWLESLVKDINIEVLLHGTGKLAKEEFKREYVMRPSFG